MHYKIDVKPPIPSPDKHEETEKQGEGLDVYGFLSNFVHSIADSRMDFTLPVNKAQWGVRMRQRPWAQGAVHFSWVNNISVGYYSKCSETCR